MPLTLKLSSLFPLFQLNRVFWHFSVQLLSRGMAKKSEHQQYLQNDTSVPVRAAHAALFTQTRTGFHAPCSSQRCSLLSGLVGILHLICFPALTGRSVISSLLLVNNEPLHSQLENPFGMQSPKCCSMDRQTIRGQFSAKSTEIKTQERRGYTEELLPKNTSATSAGNLLKYL